MHLAALVAWVCAQEKNPPKIERNSPKGYFLSSAKVRAIFEWNVLYADHTGGFYETSFYTVLVDANYMEFGCVRRRVGGGLCYGHTAAIR